MLFSPLIGSVNMNQLLSACSHTLLVWKMGLSKSIPLELLLGLNAIQFESIIEDNTACNIADILNSIDYKLHSSYDL